MRLPTCEFLLTSFPHRGRSGSAGLKEPLLSGSSSGRTDDHSTASSVGRGDSATASFQDAVHVELGIEAAEPRYGGWDAADVAVYSFHGLLLCVGLSTIVLQFV